MAGVVTASGKLPPSVSARMGIEPLRRSSSNARISPAAVSHNYTGRSTLVDSPIVRGHRRASVHPIL